MQWRPGDGWAVVEGTPDHVADAFGVEVHDYRGQRGQEFYASPQQPEVPAPLRGEVDRAGPNPQLHTASRVAAGHPAAGRAGSRADSRRAAEHLQRGRPGAGRLHRQGHHDRDLRVQRLRPVRPRHLRHHERAAQVHPRPSSATNWPSRTARPRWISKWHMRLRPTPRRSSSTPGRPCEGDGAFQKIGQMLEDTDRQFPGAIWSLSIGWGCDKLLTAADLAPVRSALADRPHARHHGVQRQRRPRRAGVQGRRRLGLPAGTRPTSGWIPLPRFPR